MKRLVSQQSSIKIDLLQTFYYLLQDLSFMSERFHPNPPAFPAILLPEINFQDLSKKRPKKETSIACLSIAVLVRFNLL